MSVADTSAPSDLYITSELRRRAPKVTDYLSEKLALQDIAAQMVDHPDEVLPKLVEIAMAMTGAASAGISALEPSLGSAEVFRWRDLRGQLANFEGATTPLNYSPCGECLDRCEPTLTRRPERYYSWISDAGVICPEVLLVPLYVAHKRALGTLWIVSEHEGEFDSGHARILQELASFVAIALALLQDKQRLLEAVQQQELLAAEMSHRVKNLFAIVDSMIRFSKRSAGSVDEMATLLSGRLHALAAAHALVRRSFSAGPSPSLPESTTLSAILFAILKPYETANADHCAATGPEIVLGAAATTALAMFFHEFATNAAKYGALARDEGRVSISWRRQGATLVLQWRETGGPPIAAPPAQLGFGSELARNTIVRQLDGTLSVDWREDGLVADVTLPLAKLAD